MHHASSALCEVELAVRFSGQLQTCDLVSAVCMRTGFRVSSEGFQNVASHIDVQQRVKMLYVKCDHNRSPKLGNSSLTIKK